MILKTKQKGSILVSILITLPFLILIVASFTQLSVNNFQVGRKDQFRTHAQFGADAGIEKSMEEINLNKNWPGTGSEITLQNDATAKVTYEVTVTNTGSSSRKVLSVGRTYFPSTSTTPKSTIKLEATLRAVSAGDFSIITGVGGLILSNSAKVLGGNVFVNGTVTMSNSSQIGLLLSPVDLFVAHQNCPNPPNSTYPKVCNSGENGQPITLTNSARIYGNVKANNQTNGSAMSNGGLQTPHCLQPATGGNCVTPQPLPAHDRVAQIAAVTTTRSGADASCTSNGGTKIWAANTKITGDVEISKSCTVTVQGNVWITGAFTMSNSGKLVVANSLGTTRPDIMVDGQNTKIRNSAAINGNLSGTGVQLISYWSKDSCTINQTSPCNLTGQPLKDSQTELTIELDNSASGAQTIFYAKWSKVMVSNSGQIGSLVGQTVELKNSGSITFGSSITSGLSFWVVEGYKRVF